MKITRDGRKIDIRLNEKDIVKMKKDPHNSSVKCPYCKEKYLFGATAHMGLDVF
jgi:redox-regulated HSP33 family molecular chaperone